MGLVRHSRVTPCYLAGSMITTPMGDRAVESLTIGDQVMIWDDATGATISDVIVWTGSRTVTICPDLADDLAGYPVRILRDAIADGVPYQDLLVTAEHRLFFDGKLVPARMLVNGRSIFYDHSMPVFDAYHVETTRHSILVANGACIESSVGIDNHRSFREAGGLAEVGNSRFATTAKLVVPLDVSRNFVEPLYRHLASRAEAAGLDIRAAEALKTVHSDLHLRTENGSVIRPARERDGLFTFVIPAGVTAVRIASNASRPSDVIGPFIDDRRKLGVSVGEVLMVDGENRTAITSHLTTPELDGWHAPEAGRARWTSGNALLLLGDRRGRNLGLLSIEILAAGPSLAESASIASVARSA